MGVRYITEVSGWNPHLRETNVFRVEIEDVNYIGDPVILEPAVSGISLEYQNNELVAFPAVSPSFLNINLIATADFSLINLFTDNERNLPVTLYRDNVVFGKYVIIPSNTKEPFIDPPYAVSLRAVDGLGLLDKHKYTSTSGQASILTVVNRCLTKLGLGLNINTFSTIIYDGMVFGEDVFNETRINQERFTGKNCGQVIEELMREWVSGIFQVNGEWFLIRYPDYLKASGTVTFKSYDSSLNPLSPVNINPNLVLGANVGDIIHSMEATPMRSMNLAYKQVSIRYEYGLVKSLLNADQRFLFGTILGFNAWNTFGSIQTVPRSQLSGTDPFAIIYGKNYVNVDLGEVIAMKSFVISAVVDLKLTIEFNVGNANGIPYLIAFRENPSSPTMYLDSNNTWITTQSFAIRYFYNYNESGGNTWGRGERIIGSTDFALPSSGEITVALCRAFYFDSNEHSIEDGMAKIYEVNMIPSTPDGAIISETHTVVNSGDYSQIPDTVEVSTGESMHSFYLGTMFKADGSTPTNGFSDDGGLVYEKFLDLATKDILFQHGKPMSVYEGSVLGTPNFLSRININDLNGIFMPMSLRYDFRSSVTEVTLIETNTVDVPHTVLATEFEYEGAKQTNQQG